MLVNDLLRLDGAPFVEAAYSTILKRQADPNGLDHFVGCLASGDSKEAILVTLATSTEARGSRIDLIGLPDLIKKRRKSPWRRFLLLFSELRRIPRQLARIEYLLREQRQSTPNVAIPSPVLPTENSYAPEPVTPVDDLSRTLAILQKNLSNTAHDADLFIENLKRTIRSSPSFFVSRSIN